MKFPQNQGMNLLVPISISPIKNGCDAHLDFC